MTAVLQDLLKQRKVLRARDLTAAGLSGRQITRAVGDGLLVRPRMLASAGPVTGVYASPEALTDPWLEAVIATLLTEGVVGRNYAATLHSLVTQYPSAVDVYVPHGSTDITSKANIRLHRSRRPGTMTVGIETVPTELGVPVRITTKARTVVDLLRTRNVNSDDYRHGIEALSVFVEEGGMVAEVMDIAQHFEGWLPEAVAIACNAASEAHVRRFGA